MTRSRPLISNTKCAIRSSFCIYPRKWDTTKLHLESTPNEAIHPWLVGVRCSGALLHCKRQSLFSSIPPPAVHSIAHLFTFISSRPMTIGYLSHRTYLLNHGLELIPRVTIIANTNSQFRIVCTSVPGLTIGYPCGV